MHCRPLVKIGDKALVFGLRDCTVVGGGTSLLKTVLRHSPRRFEKPQYDWTFGQADDMCPDCTTTTLAE